MPRYKLRTLLMALALGPPMLAYVWFNPPPHPAGTVSVIVLIIGAFLAVTAAIEGVVWCLSREKDWKD